MIQFYFLSIVLNAVAGYILISQDDGVLEFKSGFSIKDETFRLIVGILSAVTGLLKILSVIEGDIPVVGDLLPAVAGFVSGSALILEYYRSRSYITSSDQTDKINNILIGQRKIIGFAALIVAVLHFLFPKVLLL